MTHWKQHLHHNILPPTSEQRLPHLVAAHQTRDIEITVISITLSSGALQLHLASNCRQKSDKKFMKHGDNIKRKCCERSISCLLDQTVELHTLFIVEKHRKHLQLRQ